MSRRGRKNLGEKEESKEEEREERNREKEGEKYFGVEKKLERRRNREEGKEGLKEFIPWKNGQSFERGRNEEEFDPWSATDTDP